jgi:hypothetical protein
VSWWQGKDATMLPTADSFTLSIQRQLTSTLMVEAAYSGVRGTHLQSGLDNFNQVPYTSFQQYGASLLNSSITSPAAIAAGGFMLYPRLHRIRRPLCDLIPKFWRLTRVLRGDLAVTRPITPLSSGSRSAMAAGLSLQTSYVFAKTISDSDSPAGYVLAMDQANHRLDKSLSGFDITHNFKISGIYELPFGKGKKYLTDGVGAALAGGWRVGGIAYYSSGLPVSLTTTVALPIFAGTNRPTISTYDGWGCSDIENFDPSVNTFFKPAASFGPQPTTVFGNATRYNPKCRQFANLTENLSVSRSFTIHETMNLDFRFEMFNAFNRVRFGTGSTTLQSQTFGRLTSNSDILNNPRQIQFGLKFYW